MQFVKVFIFKSFSTKTYHGGSLQTVERKNEGTVAEYFKILTIFRSITLINHLSIL